MCDNDSRHQLRWIIRNIVNDIRMSNVMHIYDPSYSFDDDYYHYFMNNYHNNLSINNCLDILNKIKIWHDHSINCNKHFQNMLWVNNLQSVIINELNYLLNCINENNNIFIN